MRSRLVAVLVAILMGLLATWGVARYVGGVRKQVETEVEQVEILVARESVPTGLSVDDMLKRRLLEKKKVPRKYVVTRAVYTAKDVDGRVSTVPLTKGEQLTIDKFQVPAQAGVTYVVPKDQVAISVPVDDVRGVSGLIRTGDLVTVIATVQDKMGEETTKVLLQHVKVLAVGGSTTPSGEQKSTLASTGSRQQAAVKPTITLALSPADAEKLVFAEEVGKVWLTLIPATGGVPARTSGRTMQTLFR